MTQKIPGQLARRFKKAEMIRTTAEGFAVDIARSIGLKNPEDAVERGPIKEPSRIIAKANGRANGDLSKVRDIARGTLIFDTPQDFLTIRKLFAQFEKNPSGFVTTWANRGIKVLEFEDNFSKQKPHGFRGAKIVIQIGKGIDETYELRFLYKHMRVTDKLSHAIYEEKRKIEDTALENAARQASLRGEYLEIPTDLKKRRALAQTFLTDEQKQIIAGYEATIKLLYETDARNYGLDVLLTTDTKKPATTRGVNGTGQHLQLDA